LRAVDGTLKWMQDDAAALRAADADLCRALAELQEILDSHDAVASDLGGEELQREWLLSLSVVRDALQAVERIAQLLARAAEAEAPARGG
jgi:hypothetical protein